MNSVGNSAHAISDARRGAGTSGEPVTDGTTRQTARKMKNWATAHAATANQNSANSSGPGTVDETGAD